MNKDLILREKLAIERTDMAIDRTFLSFNRTSLYFAVAGLTLNSIIRIPYGLWIGIILFIFSGLILGIGFYKFCQQKKRLLENKKHIGNYILEWIDDVEV